MFSRSSRFTAKIENTPGPGDYEAEQARLALETHAGVALPKSERFKEVVVEETPVVVVDEPVVVAPPKPPRMSMKPPRKTVRLSVSASSEEAGSDTESTEFSVLDTAEERARKQARKAYNEALEAKAALNAVKEECDEKIRSVVGQLAEAQTRYGEAVAQFEEDISRLSGKLQESADTIATLDSKCGAADVTITTLTSELQTAKTQCDELQAKLNHTITQYESRLADVTQRMHAQHGEEVAKLGRDWSIKLASAEAQWRTEMESIATEYASTVKIMTTEYEAKLAKQSTEHQKLTEFERVSAFEAIEALKSTHEAEMQAALSKFEADVTSMTSRHMCELTEAESAHKELVNAVRDSCAQEVTAAQRDAEAHRALAQQAEANITTLKAKVTQLQDRVIQQDAAISELRRRHADEAEEKEKVIAETTSENKRLQSESSENRATIDRLTQEFATSKASWSADSARMCELYEAKCKAVTDSMADLKARFKRELATKDAALESTKAKLAGAEKQVVIMEEASKVTQQMIEGLAQEKATLSQKFTESSVTIDMLRAQISNATQKMETMITIHASLQQAYEASQQRYNELQACNAQLETNSVSLTAQVDCLGAEIKSLKASAETNAATITSLSSDVESTRQSNEMLTASLQSALTTATQLQSDLDAVTDKYADTKTRYRELQGKLTCTQARLDEVQAQLTAEESEQLSTGAQLQLLQARFADAEVLIASQTTSINELTASMTRVEHELEAERTLRSRVEVDLAAKAEQLDAVLSNTEPAEKVKALEGQLDSVQAEKEALQSLLSKVRAAGPLEDILSAKERAGELEAREIAALKELQHLTSEAGRLAGHQNTKQKIHYVMQLKKENVDLKLKLAELTAKLDAAGVGKDKTLRTGKGKAPLGTHTGAVTKSAAPSSTTL